MKFTHILLALAICAPVIHAENWTRFRGPSGQGYTVESGLPTQWSADSNIQWKTTIPGNGWSSPVIWGDRVFLSTTTEQDQSCRVICVDRKSGEIEWNVEVFRQTPGRKEGQNSYATPTLALDSCHAYAVFGNGGVAALTHSGEVVWTNLEVEFYSRHGLGASPILWNDLVIMPYDGSQRVDQAGDWPNNPPNEKVGWQIPWDKALIVALNKNTGQREWGAKRGMSRIAHITPIVIENEGRPVMISAAGDVIQGFNPANGELIWTCYSQGEGVTPGFAIGDGKVFTSSGFERTTLRTVRLGGKGDVTETHIAWEQRKGVPTMSSLLYAEPYVYAVTDGGIVTCFNKDDGEIVYQERIGGRHSASPVLIDNKIYFLSEEGETTIIPAGPEFKILAQNRLNDETTRASIAVSQGNLFIRTQNTLFCIGE